MRSIERYLEELNLLNQNIVKELSSKSGVIIIPKDRIGKGKPLTPPFADTQLRIDPKLRELKRETKEIVRQFYGKA